MLGQPWRILSGDAHTKLAADIAGELDLTVESATVTRFADGEANTVIKGDMCDAAVVIVQPTCPPVAENLMTLALMADAAKAAGAVRVIAVVPYFGYARQEERSRDGQPRVAQVAARLLEAVALVHRITPASTLPAPTALDRTRRRDGRSHPAPALRDTDATSRGV
jgi:ribose-phosphate pyrophosphokinase